MVTVLLMQIRTHQRSLALVVVHAELGLVHDRMEHLLHIIQTIFTFLVMLLLAMALMHRRVGEGMPVVRTSPFLLFRMPVPTDRFIMRFIKRTRLGFIGFDKISDPLHILFRLFAGVLS